MPQQVRRRSQKTLGYSSNNKVSEMLGRGMVYRELHLKLSCQPTLLAGNNVYANILRGDEWAAVKKIEIIANGTQTLRSFSGNTLRWLNMFWYGRAPAVSPLLGAGGANPTCESTLILPFWMPRSVRPMDTALDSRQLSDLKIEVTWGSYTDIAASATGWTTEPSLRVDSIESFNIDGPFAMWRQWEIEKTISASSTAFQVPLTVGGLWRGFFLNTTDAGVDEGDIMTNFKWKSGTTVFADVDHKVLQDSELLRNGIVRSYSGTAYDDHFQGDANDVDGWYNYDHVTDGLLTEAVDTAGFSEHELELDVTVGAGTTKLLVVPSQVIPVRGAS